MVLQEKWRDATGTLQNVIPFLPRKLTAMKPKPSPCEDLQGDLFKIELEAIVDMNHAMVKLAGTVDWARLEKTFGALYCEDNGAPGLSTRLMVALHYLKFTFDLSDEDVVAGWVENPYWQYLSGMKHFEHRRPIDPSSMTNWRKRVGQAGAEAMLKETIEAGLKLKAIKASQLARVNVDTTVQEKHVRFPTDARLYNRARERLVQAADRRGIRLRQNYRRVGKRLLLQSSRYMHARQAKRAARCRKKLRTILGRVIRDIERKYPRPDKDFANLIEIAKRIHAQERYDKNKIYSVHEPHVACIAKGKAHKRYEFGAKVSVAATSRGGWFVGAMAMEGNPYDGHTLAATLEQIERLARAPKKVFVDRGYRGHDYNGPVEVHVDRTRRGKLAVRLWRWMKRRAAIEPGIGHLKHEHRMDRCRLWGAEGDGFNAIASATGMNFRKLLAHAAVFYCLLLRLAQIARRKHTPTLYPVSFAVGQAA
jgi:IS5 family transposase